MKLMANITTSGAYNFTANPNYPIEIDANGFNIKTGSSGTWGGSLTMTSSAVGILQIAGAYTTYINGGTYIMNGNNPIIYANAGQGVSLNDTKVYLSNATFTVNGTSNAASIIKFVTNDGNTISASNCIFNTTAKSIAFSLQGPKYLIIDNCTLTTAGSDASTIIFKQNPGKDISNVTVDGLSLNMTNGIPFDWSGGNQNFNINTIIKDLNINGSPAPTISKPTVGGGTGVKKFYDFRPYSITAAKSGSNVNLTFLGTGTGDAENATIVYTSDGSEPTASSATYSSSIPVTTNTIIKVAPYKDGFIGKSNTFQFITNNSTISDLGNVANSNINMSNGATLTINEPVTLNSITVAPGAKLTTSSGQTLTANTLYLNSDATGTATYLDNGTTNITTANVQQYLTSARNWYISSPIETKTVPSGSVYFGYDETGENTDLSVSAATAYWKPYASGTPLTAGKGYIAQPSGETTLEFIGTLNTGNTTVQLSRTALASKPGFNLVGNPYPSYLDWSKVAVANTNVLPTAWFRTKKTIEEGGGYTFATVNVAVPSTPIVVANNANTTITKYIPPMQAYWVRLIEDAPTTNYTVSNAMRDHLDNVGNKFKAPKQNELKLIRLVVSDGTNRDETVLYFTADASDAYDRYDSPKMSSGTSVPEIYTLAGNEQLVINGLNSSAMTSELPLGFTTAQSGTFSIQATEINNFETDAPIILKDKLLNTEQLLSVHPIYTFTSDISSGANRFSLIFKSPTAITETELQNLWVTKNANNQIIVNYSGDVNGVGFVSVYNAVGQKLLTRQIERNVTVIDSVLPGGVYIVTVSKSGKNITRRVILN
jgi:hypothetical protein